MLCGVFYLLFLFYQINALKDELSANEKKYEEKVKEAEIQIKSNEDSVFLEEKTVELEKTKEHLNQYIGLTEQWETSRK